MFSKQINAEQMRSQLSEEPLRRTVFTHFAADIITEAENENGKTEETLGEKYILLTHLLPGKEKQWKEIITWIY